MEWYIPFDTEVFDCTPLPYIKQIIFSNFAEGINIWNFINNPVTNINTRDIEQLMMVYKEVCVIYCVTFKSKSAFWWGFWISVPPRSNF